MNISTSVAPVGAISRMVTVTSDIELHEDTIWAIAAQALATSEGLRVQRLSRDYEAYDIRRGEGTTYIARFEGL